MVTKGRSERMAVRIRVLAIGKIKEKYLRDAIAEYQKRLSGYAGVTVMEYPDEPIPGTLTEGERTRILSKESDPVLSELSPSEVVVLLDCEGTQWSSEDLAETLRKLTVSGKSRFAFVIGGSLGVSPALRERADFRWCLSSATFPHQIVRLLVLEQCYRAMRINSGETYHR
jgi:23S rRNA (pseudouridine1915-N3)-methyltransferase